MNAGQSLQVDLDGAWPPDVLPEVPVMNARDLGPSLRFSATNLGMREFRERIESRNATFHLLGSGDFHHLTSMLLLGQQEPFTLVSFDNHPDWDVRPPRWCCGSWISRALEQPTLEKAVVWGCGNFELHRPTSFFGNHRALRSGRLEVRPWAERMPPAVQQRWSTIDRQHWREQFAASAQRLSGKRVYITVDLDALQATEAVTNWENGLFTAAEIAWALRELHGATEVIGGDVCGAYSEPHYARWGQRFIAKMDHPKLAPIDPQEAQRRNMQTLRQIWPALTGGSTLR